MGETMMMLLFLFSCGEPEFLYECQCTRRGTAKSLEDGGVDEELNEIFTQNICETETNFANAFKDNGIMTDALDECEVYFGEEYDNVKCACECEYVGDCE